MGSVEKGRNEDKKASSRSSPFIFVQALLPLLFSPFFLDFLGT